MPRSIVEITRREEFSASHRLHNPALSAEENRRLYGICNNPNGHGHNYEVEVTVRGEVPARTGMVMNLTDLMRILRERVLPRVDHKHLNLDVPFLAEVNPTAENVAIALWHQIEPEVRPYEGCRLHRIRLFESRSSYVDFLGPET
jgi:6-pyruvoyltetrahydropterin/6-carboxytetrahydropterin synthase